MTTSWKAVRDNLVRRQKELDDFEKKYVDFLDKSTVWAGKLSLIAVGGSEANHRLDEFRKTHLALAAQVREAQWMAKRYPGPEEG